MSDKYFNSFFKEQQFKMLTQRGEFVRAKMKSHLWLHERIMVYICVKWLRKYFTMVEPFVYPNNESSIKRFGVKIKGVCYYLQDYLNSKK
jgi:hypothetical protein